MLLLAGTVTLLVVLGSLFTVFFLVTNNKPALPNTNGAVGSEIRLHQAKGQQALADGNYTLALKEFDAASA